MEKTMIAYQDVIEDLKHVLIGYLTPLNLKFTVGPEQPYINDVFSKIGAMPLFLHDKQEFLNEYISILNIQFPQLAKENGQPLFAQLQVQKADGSFFGTKFEILHNIPKEGGHFDKLVLALAKVILSQDSFIMTDNTISLDYAWHQYNEYLKDLISKQLEAAGSKNFDLNKKD